MPKDMILVSSELSMKNNEQFGVNMFGTFGWLFI